MSGKAKPQSLRWLWCVLAAMSVYCAAANAFLRPAFKQAVAEHSDEESADCVTAEGYGIYIDDVLIAACGEYDTVKAGLDAALSGLAAACGAPEGDNSFGNDVRVISGEYDSGLFVDEKGVSALLGVDGDAVVFDVRRADGGDAGVELTVNTRLNAALSEITPRPVVENYTDLLENGEVMVIEEGRDGVVQNAYDLSYVNGLLTEKVLCGTAVVVEPTAKEELCGTDSGQTLLSAGDAFALPYVGVVTSSYGYRLLWDKTEMHNGIDFAAYGGCYGDPIHAAADGIVSFSGWKGNYGNAVMIDHTKSLTSLYAHCSKLLVEEGEYVRKGQVIALIGNTGRVTGAHLHYSMLLNGVFCDPRPYLDWSGNNG